MTATEKVDIKAKALAVSAAVDSSNDNSVCEAFERLQKAVEDALYEDETDDEEGEEEGHLIEDDEDDDGDSEDEET